MTYKNSFFSRKTAFTPNLPWNPGEFRSILENDRTFAPQTSRAVVTWLADYSVVFCRGADSLFGEKLSHSFLWLFWKREAHPSSLLPCWIGNHWKAIFSARSTPPRADFANQFTCVGGLRCFKSRKPEDRLGCHRLLEIACGACIGHWAERSA